jgi:prepilin-type N-terminal cleavage/methylation domain-containing protein
MSTEKIQRSMKWPIGRGKTGLISSGRRQRGQKLDEGFTLVELLIVVTILPMIVGALSLGLISILSLQSGVANRLANTSDSQVVSASYQDDIQSAGEVTTAATSTPQCGAGTGTQLLGLESDLNRGTGVWQTTISYVSVTNSSAPTPTYSLERLFCINGSYTPVSTTTLSYNLQSSQAVPAISCVSSASSLLCSQSLAAQQYISAQNISDITFTVVEPEPNNQNASPSCATGSYCYSLTGSPVASASSTNTGSPFTANTTTSCGFASPDTGTYSGSLCFVDFSFLNSPAAMAQATGGGCLELSVSLPGNYTMYFCLQIVGNTVLPWYLPTYPQAFLGNINNISGVNVPFYTGIAGDPALYQRVSGSLNTINFTNISVVSPNGTLATGWEAVSADAESTDPNEYITWTANTAVNWIPNGEAVDIVDNSPVGNACNTGVDLVQISADEVECSNVGGTSVTKTGTTMVAAIAPSSLSATMQGNGLQAITFGLLVP